jgi:hypothetical protein
VVASWRPSITVQIAFDADPNDSSAVPTWVDLSHLFMRMSSCRRGRQYELDKNQASAPTVEFYDPDELLNPANTSSPHYGYILPYRQILIQAVWPNTAAGNILNTAGSILYKGQPHDGSFESHSAGDSPWWLSGVGDTSPTITASTPYQGTNSATWAVADGTTVQGVEIALPCVPGRQYTVSAYVRQTSASTQVISVDGSAGTSTTTTGSYVRLAKTFTATQPTHACRVATTGTAVAGAVLMDAVQHEQSATATTFTTTGPIIYPVFRGFVERFPRTWKHRGIMGLCAAKAVDAFGPLNRFRIDTEVVGSYARSSPILWWPLSGGESTTQWGDQSGAGGSQLARVTSPLGAGADLIPGVGNMLPGDPDGLGVEIPAKATAASGSTALGNVFPLSISASGSTFAISLAIWYTNADSDPSATSPWGAPIMLYNQATGAFFYVYIDPVNEDVGAGTGLESAGGTAFDLAYNDAGVYEPGATRHLVATFSADAGTTTVYFYENGVLTGSSSRSTSLTYGSASPDVTTTAAWVGGRPWSPIGSAGLTGECMPGIYAHAGVWDRELTADEVADMYASGLGGAGETPGDRISRYLSYGWSGGTNINPGYSTMGVNSLTKRTALLAACQDVATTENGNFWADSSGTVQLAGRDDRYLTVTPLCTFGEDVASGEYPYGDGVTYDIDPMRIYNEVTVTNSGGIVSRRTDEASIKRFFPNSYERTINVADDNEAIACAQWILTNHKDPQQRIASLTLDPASNPNLWPVVLGVEVEYRVTVKNRPKAANSGAGITMSGDYFIESISHDLIDMDSGAWRSTLTMSPVPALRAFILDDATYGILDDTSLTLAY